MMLLSLDILSQNLRISTSPTALPELRRFLIFFKQWIWRTSPVFICSATTPVLPSAARCCGCGYEITAGNWWPYLTWGSTGITPMGDGSTGRLEVPTGRPAIPTGWPAIPTGWPAVPTGWPAVPTGWPAVPTGGTGVGIGMRLYMELLRPLALGLTAGLFVSGPTDLS